MAEKETKVPQADNKKLQKPKKEKKKGKIKEAWRGFKSEFKKISWPTWEQVRKNTLVVLVVVAVCAVILFGLDFAFSYGMKMLTGLFA